MRSLQEDSPILEDKGDEKKLEAENAGDGAAEEELQDPRREDQPQEEKREEEEPRNPEDEGHEFPEQEDFEIEVYRMAIPIESKSGPSVMDGIIQIYLQLMTDGFPIRQLHTDRAREFMAKDLERWCKNRCIYKTTTSGDAHQQNGRAERAVQAVKARIRTLLFPEGLGHRKMAISVLECTPRRKKEDDQGLQAYSTFWSCGTCEEKILESEGVGAYTSKGDVHLPNAGESWTSGSTRRWRPTGDCVCHHEDEGAATP